MRKAIINRRWSALVDHWSESIACRFCQIKCLRYYVSAHNVVDELRRMHGMQSGSKNTIACVCQGTQHYYWSSTVRRERWQARQSCCLTTSLFSTSQVGSMLSKINVIRQL